MGGDVDSTQVLCFDRFPPVFSQVGGQGEKYHANSSSPLPALYVTFFRIDIADLLKTHTNRQPLEIKQVNNHSMNP